MSSSNSSIKSEGHEGHEGVSKVIKSGANNEYIHLGNKRYHKDDLMEAFGGTMNPGLSPWPVHEFANPAPLGLSAFAFTTFVLSLFNAQAMGITVSNVVVGAACFYGGAVQFLAGVWELGIGNTFGGTALTSYGAFWLSFAAINIKAFGIAEAYEDPDMLRNATGLYLLGWALVTLLFVLTTIKSTVAFFSLFLFLFITFILLAAGHLADVEGVTRAGGVVGVITAFLGWYNAFAGVATKSNSYITVRAIPMPFSVKA